MRDGCRERERPDDDGDNRHYRDVGALRHACIPIGQQKEQRATYEQRETAFRPGPAF